LHETLEKVAGILLVRREFASRRDERKGAEDERKGAKEQRTQRKSIN
jgi:hypothetical protein